MTVTSKLLVHLDRVMMPQGVPLTAHEQMAILATATRRLRKLALLRALNHSPRLLDDELEEAERWVKGGSVPHAQIQKLTEHQKITLLTAYLDFHDRLSDLIEDSLTFKHMRENHPRQYTAIADRLATLAGLPHVLLQDAAPETASPYPTLGEYHD